MLTCFNWNGSETNQASWRSDGGLRKTVGIESEQFLSNYRRNLYTLRFPKNDSS